MIRRTASEVLRSLEMRVARLEGRLSKKTASLGMYEYLQMMVNTFNKSGFVSKRHPLVILPEFSSDLSIERAKKWTTVAKGQTAKGGFSSLNIEVYEEGVFAVTVLVDGYVSPYDGEGALILMYKMPRPLSPGDLYRDFVNAAEDEDFRIVD